MQPIEIKTEKTPIGWTAYDDRSYDGPGSAVGHGKSEEEAVEDLIEQLIDRGIAKQ